jgi:hypothetical protein
VVIKLNKKIGALNTAVLAMSERVIKTPITGCGDIGYLPSKFGVLCPWSGFVVGHAKKRENRKKGEFPAL